MRTSMSRAELCDYTARQLNNIFPDGRDVAATELLAAADDAPQRVEHCFSHILWPTYSLDGEAHFNVLHSDQYCSYLYLLSNALHRRQADPTVSAKVFGLNKALHAFNCMYDTELPEVFWLVHIVGTVLGKADYGNFLVVRQGCTIGAVGGEYPTLGEGLVLSAGSSIIGTCTIGDNVMVGPGCHVFKTDVPAGTLVTAGTELRMRPNSPNAFSAHFRRAPA